MYEQRGRTGAGTGVRTGSGIVLARFTYQGRTRYVITKSGGFGQEDLLVELADRIAKH